MLSVKEDKIFKEKRLFNGMKEGSHSKRKRVYGKGGHYLTDTYGQGQYQKNQNLSLSREERDKGKQTNWQQILLKYTFLQFQVSKNNNYA